MFCLSLLVSVCNLSFFLPDAPRGLLVLLLKNQHFISLMISIFCFYFTDFGSCLYIRWKLMCWIPCTEAPGGLQSMGSQSQTQLSTTTPCPTPCYNFVSYHDNAFYWLLSLQYKKQSRISSVQFSCSVVYDSATPWTRAFQASLSITNSWSPPKPMSIESEMPSNHLILCHPLLLLPSIFCSIRVFSNESLLHIRWPKYWSFT